MLREIVQNAKDAREAIRPAGGTRYGHCSEVWQDQDVSNFGDGEQRLAELIADSLRGRTEGVKASQTEPHSVASELQATRIGSPLVGDDSGTGAA